MVKRTPPKKNKQKTKTSRGSTRRDDQNKPRRGPSDRQLVETRPRPMDLEPDGGAVNEHTSRYAAISVLDSSSDEEIILPAFAQRTMQKTRPPSQPPEPFSASTVNGASNDANDTNDDESNGTSNYDSDYTPPPEDEEASVLAPTFKAVEQQELQHLHDDSVKYDQLIAEGYTDLNEIKVALHYNEEEFLAYEPSEGDSHNSSSMSTEGTASDPRPPPTYLDIAALKEPTQEFTPQATDHTRSLRYSLRITVPAHPEPMKQLLKAIKHVLRVVQQASSKSIGIGAWNTGQSNSTYSKPSEIPTGEDTTQAKKAIQKYFDSWIKPSTDKNFTAFLKIRFVTNNPASLSIPLKELGLTLEDEISSCNQPTKEPTAFLSRNPIACQAIKVATVGWLFGSVKTMRHDTLLAGLRKELDIPLEVELGISWRTIRNSQRKNPAWVDDQAPPQALTIEIDESYYSIYAPKIAALWKKRSRRAILHLQLRLVPCFTSARMASADDRTKVAVAVMAHKQQALINENITRIPVNKFIAFLDTPIPDPENPSDSWTLRRYIMKATPRGFPTRRLFVSVDQAWDGDGFHFTTVKHYFDEAERAMTNLIPECLHFFGPNAAKWFTSVGLRAFKDVVYDPQSGTTLSNDVEFSGTVDENFYGMGDSWKANLPPELKMHHTKDADNHETTTPTGTKGTTAKEVLEQRLLQARSDLSIKSFGDEIFDREHDGDTVHTVHASATSDRVEVDLTGIELQQATRTTGDDETLSVSTGAQTTEGTRQKYYRANQRNKELEAENVQQAREMENLENERDVLEREREAMRMEMEAMRQQLAALRTPQSQPIKPRRTVTIHTPPSFTQHPGRPPDAVPDGIGQSP
jgi:hypothetical protein